MIVTTNYGVGFPGIADGRMTEEWETTRGFDRLMIANGYEPGELKLGFPASWITFKPVKNAAGVYDPTLPENQRRARLTLAVACLFGGYGCAGRYEGDAAWCEARVTDPNWFFKQYEHPQRGRGWLGEPIEAAHQSRSDRFIWMREFQFGIVICNNDPNQPHSVYLPKRCRPIGGVVKDGWSIPEHDALIAEWV